MLPGLTRTAAQPASIAAKTYLGWKWMSAMTGICDFLAIAGSASASSVSGTATRTIWQPDGGELGDLLQRRVDVGGLRRRHRLHADRGVAADADAADVELAGLPAGGETGGGAAGMPRLTGIAMLASIPRSPIAPVEATVTLPSRRSVQGDRVDDVGDEQQR